MALASSDCAAVLLSGEALYRGQDMGTVERLRWLKSNLETANGPSSPLIGSRRERRATSTIGAVRCVTRPELRAR